jgi:hypothetical protein
MEINPEIDLEVDLHNLTQEFKKFSLLLYRYYEYKAKVESQRDLAKSKVKEVRANSYKRIKSDQSVKHTEKSLEAEIDTDPLVLDAQMRLIKAEHDATTWGGAVDSMKAKMNCLMQLGADRRKEN